MLEDVERPASMRPPQNAGEDSKRTFWVCRVRSSFNEAPAERGGRLHESSPVLERQTLASMRPPQNAGEDDRSHMPKGKAARMASMRPPQNAGEDAVLEAACSREHRASMRPPQNAGEDAHALLRLPLMWNGLQ